MSKYSKIFSTAILAFALSAPVYADANLYGDIGLASDYNFRGVSLSDENPSIGGTLGVKYNNGVFIQGEANQVDINGDDAQVNYTAGVTKGALTLSATRYTYQGGTTDNATEISAGVAGKVFGVAGTASVAHNTDTSDNYFNVSGAVPIPFGLTATATYGVLDNAGAGDNIDDWSVSLGRSFGALSVSVGYYASDSNFSLSTLNDENYSIKVGYTF